MSTLLRTFFLVLKIQLVNGEIWKLKFIIWLCTCSKHRYFVFERWFFTEEWVGGIASIGWFFMFFQQQTKRILWFGFSNFLCYNCWQFCLESLYSKSNSCGVGLMESNFAWQSMRKKQVIHGTQSTRDTKSHHVLFHQWNLRRADLWSLGVGALWSLADNEVA